eukprot:3941954-Rhodomonas_salina.2
MPAYGATRSSSHAMSGTELAYGDALWLCGVRATVWCCRYYGFLRVHHSGYCGCTIVAMCGAVLSWAMRLQAMRYPLRAGAPARYPQPYAL